MDTRGSASNQGLPGGVSSSRPRGQIAAQACNNCRTRKQRCDEAKPRCGNCHRLGMECQYSEPVPTKKDTTLLEILRRITSVERKVDDLAGRSVVPIQRQNLSLRPIQSLPSEESSLMPKSLSEPSHFGYADDARAPDPEHFSSPSTKLMMEWPLMQHLLDIAGKDKGSHARDLPVSSRPAAYIDEGQLPLSLAGITSTPYSTGPSTPSPFQYPSPAALHTPLNSVLAWSTVQPLSKGYFDTFNQLYPIVNEELFMNHTIPNFMGRSPIDNTSASALVFLVLALGEVALTSTNASTPQQGGPRSGIRGGTPQDPPGVAFFNEARHRLGLFSTEPTVENLQVLSLTALFFASSGRAGDCWRTAASATLICQSLAPRAHDADGPSHETITRLFHHCAGITFVLGAELHLPITDLEPLRHFVGLPSFARGQSEEDYLTNQISRFQDYGQSQIFILRLFSSLYNSLGQTSSNDTTLGNAWSAPENIREKIRRYTKQLERWRELLPPHLTWEDNHFLGFDPDECLTEMLIDNNLIDTTMTYPYISMMQLALIRSQYSLGRHMIFRYYVYKVLHHHPDALQSDDYRGAAECLKAALRWPITMAPPSMNKRLIPLPFYWSQNICGALILLHLARQHPLLNNIRTTLCGPEFETDCTETINLYIHWLRDMKQICVVSQRCWRIIRPLFLLEE